MLRLAVNHLSLVVLVKGYLSAFVRSGNGIDIPSHYDHPSDRRTLPDVLDFEKGFMFHFSRFNSDLSELIVSEEFSVSAASVPPQDSIAIARNLDKTGYIPFFGYCKEGTLDAGLGINILNSQEYGHWVCRLFNHESSTKSWSAFTLIVLYTKTPQ